MALADARLDTYYLPARRRAAAEVAESARLFARGLAARFFDEHPLPTLVLDDSRQILYANRSASSLFGLAPELALGRRLGEALGCARCPEAPNGCGTGSFCRYCGAARAIEASASGSSAHEECYVSREASEGGGDSIELLVWTSPLELEGRACTLLTARDISEQKRREVLERVFYHDIANTATGIGVLVELLRAAPDREEARRLELLRAASAQLVEEIDSQRALRAAEEGSLALALDEVDSLEALRGAVGCFEYFLYNREAEARIEPGSERFSLRTDPVLLRRVLANMVKNALEAAERGEAVLLRSERSGGLARFSVSNRAVMAEEVRARVFQRSFSTKGPGRGLGSYGMRLLGERYLGGKVEFSSAEGAGTTFTLSLPLEPGP
ncbi:MAG TPA: ATP-binding protein [Spirochaetales bacterium]|nr:ATP-binding protein [Spirochaetales bacterium]HRY56002.1 ATP-binding protein [Spirochaetia bacterium]HRZ65837.1 ATP-binding protein [Spirochaetia bacterium]